VAAIQRTGAAKDGIPALLPVGLGAKSGEFDKIFLDTYQRVVLRGEKPRAVIRPARRGTGQADGRDRCAVLAADPASTGACAVK